MATHGLNVSAITINSFGTNSWRIEFAEDETETVCIVLIQDIVNGAHLQIPLWDWPAIRAAIDSFFNQSDELKAKLATYDWQMESTDQYMEDDTAF